MQHIQNTQCAVNIKSYSRLHILYTSHTNQASNNYVLLNKVCFVLITLIWTSLISGVLEQHSVCHSSVIF